MVDELEIENLRELEKNATPGPWEPVSYVVEAQRPDGLMAAIMCGDGISRLRGCNYFGRRFLESEAYLDAKFIAASRNTFPRLLNTVERLRIERDAALAQIRLLTEQQRAKSEDGG